jgi:hypothetical protein
MLRTPSPPLRSLAEDVTPMGKSGFRALAGPLKQVRWPEKFKTGNIDRYDSSNNLKNLFRCTRPSLRPSEEAIG